ncbi:MAG: ATP-binding protein [Proteobacteria bacterium]|nr:ATP-binding protein [Pseudomonadota bacterium]
MRIGIIDAGAAVLVTVADDGSGIPPGAEEKIFDRFVQLPRPADRKIGGSGLGLSIARDLVTAMGGRIGTEPSVKGAHFFFELPRAPKMAPPDIANGESGTEDRTAQPLSG